MKIAALILGIASIVCCYTPFVGVICAIIAIILANKAVAAEGVTTPAKVGKITGIIGLILSILGTVGCLACTILGGIGAAAGY